MIDVLFDSVTNTAKNCCKTVCFLIFNYYLMQSSTNEIKGVGQKIILKITIITQVIINYNYSL